MPRYVDPKPWQNGLHGQFFAAKCDTRTPRPTLFLRLARTVVPQLDCFLSAMLPEVVFGLGLVGLRLRQVQ